MSTLKTRSEQVALDVVTSNPATEIYVIDSEFNLVRQSHGSLFTHLDPGIYSVRVCAGPAIQEEDVLLLKEKIVRSYKIAFPTAAPLEGTTQTDELHCKAAKEQSRKIHVTAGRGSSIFVFARDWADLSDVSEKSKVASPPVQGLLLKDIQDNVLVEFISESEFSLNDNPWAACNVQLDPGIYLLSQQMLDGSSLDQTVVATKDWQTQIFLLQGTYESRSEERLPYLPGSSIFLSQNNFNPEDPHLMTIELARLGLINKRQVFPVNMVRKISRGEFDTPLLGLLGAHIFLSRKSNLDMLERIVSRLRQLLGPEHPDVEALALQTNAKGAYTFNVLPMLRRSWPLILDATVEDQKIVPNNSLAAHSAYYILNDEPWLIWRREAEKSKGLSEGGDIARQDDPVLNMVEELLEGVLDNYYSATDNLTKKRSAKTTLITFMGKAQELLSELLNPITNIILPQVELEDQKMVEMTEGPAEERPRTAEPLLKDNPVMKRLVQTLGIPRANIEELLKKQADKEGIGQQLKVSAQD